MAAMLVPIPTPQKNSTKPYRPAITKGLTLNKVQENQHPASFCKLLGKLH
jgi:hypothetical protein